MNNFVPKDMWGIPMDGGYSIGGGGGSTSGSGSVDRRYERLEEKIKELEAHIRKLVKNHRHEDKYIMKMIENLPETNELVNIKLIRDGLLNNIVEILSGGKSNLNIESLIDKSKTPIERRLDNIE